MKRRRFGGTDIMVSEIGFGGSRIGALLSGGPAGGVDTLHAAFDAGINFYDTADMYSQGEGEELIGRAFSGRRDRVIIATKGGYLLPTRRRLVARVKPLLRPVVRFLGITRKQLPAGASGALTQNFAPAYIAQAVHASLRRLRTEYIDVYQLHSPQPDIIASEALPAALHTLEALQRDGKIRYFGIAADLIDHADVCVESSTVQTAQVPFGLVDPDPRQRLSAWDQQGIGVIARGAFGGGILKDALTERELRELTPKCDWILALRALALQSQRSVLELALQYSLCAPAVSVTLLGMRTVEHVRQNLQRYAVAPLSDDEFAACERLAAAHAEHERT